MKVKIVYNGGKVENYEPRFSPTVDCSIYKIELGDRSLIIPLFNVWKIEEDSSEEKF